jgi:hypothetical protein
MSNRWGIPKEVEDHVKHRDRNCVYCGISFDIIGNSHKAKASWEHIINDIMINGIDNIALCCRSCNASKGAKTLTLWLTSNYCLTKGITKDSVADVVKEYLAKL